MTPSPEVAELSVEVEIDGRTFFLRPVGPEVLGARNVVAAALAVSLRKSPEWAVGGIGAVHLQSGNYGCCISHSTSQFQLKD